MLGARRLLGLGIVPKAQGPTFWDVAAATWHSCAPLLGTADAGDPSPDEQRPDKTYVDRLKVTVRAGKGGAGCVSFWRSASKGKHTPADGGDGGDGGSVIVRASSNMKSLAGVPQLLKAEGGKHGSGQKLQGRRGKDAVLLVPTGTVVSRLIEEEEEEGVEGGRGGGAEEQLPEWLQQWKRPWVGAEDYTSDDEGEKGASRQASADKSSSGNTPTAALGGKEGQRYVMLADLTEDGQEVVAARGGQGGRGNAAARALPRRPAPSAPAAPPTSGESARLILELKLMADVALVGLPNAGKSSLLRALSAAQPRVGAYPFTTLRPQLGAIFMGPGRQRVVVADVPGIIEGAHANRGLGHRFLRHAERARALALVVDVAGGGTSSKGGVQRREGESSETKGAVEGVETDRGRGGAEAAALTPWAQAELLRSEIGAYSSDLLARPWLLVANKVDLLARPGATLGTLRRHAEKAGAAGVVGVSALEGTGVIELATALEALVGQQQEE